MTTRPVNRTTRTHDVMVRSVRQWAACNTCWNVTPAVTLGIIRHWTRRKHHCLYVCVQNNTCDTESRVESCLPNLFFFSSDLNTRILFVRNFRQWGQYVSKTCWSSAYFAFWQKPNLIHLSSSKALCTSLSEQASHGVRSMSYITQFVLCIQFRGRYCAFNFTFMYTSHLRLKHVIAYII